MNNYSVPIGNMSKGKGDNLPKITALARRRFEIQVSLPHGLVPCEMWYLHILM